MKLQPAYLKTLWLLRFEKIRKGEETAAWKYQELLDQCMAAWGEHDLSVKLLHTLVSEERMHEKIADELIQLCRDSHPECGIG